MIAIAGNPRSGTSLMMRCFVEAVGVERIIGDEFPQVKRYEKQRERGEKESEAHYTARMYTMDKYPENSQEALDKVKDMNPNGFWECPFTVRGIRYRPQVNDLIKQMDEEDKENPLIVKLVNSGLFSSDPRYIDKVIYMVRHPRNIAKSQERLKREQKFTLADGRVVDLYEGQKVHDPRFYIQSTTQFASWRVEHPEVPVLFVHYDDLIADPDEELKRIAAFTGIAGIVKGSSIINPKLNRSKEDPQREHILWEDAEEIHGKLLAKDFQGILDIQADPTRSSVKQQITFICTRLRSAVAYNNCVDCRKRMDKAFIKSGKDRSAANGWAWWDEPCIFECGFDPDDSCPLSIEESIQGNHWMKV